MARRETERAALAANVLLFFAGLAAAGLLIGVLDGPFQTLVGASESVGSTSYSTRGRGYVTQFWNALPFVIVGLAFLQLLAAAAAERRVGA